MKAAQPTEPVSDVVELKPILGIQPGFYLAGLYAVLIVLALFFLLFFPGIANGGTWFTIETAPEGASVWVDNTRVGHTPLEVFISAGDHLVRISRPHFRDARVETTVGRRVFGSLLFPRREAWSITLEATSVDALVDAAAGEFASWSFVGESSSRYQFPPVARWAALDLSVADPSGAGFDRFLDAALPQATSETLLADLAAGTAIAGSAGGAAGPLQIVELVQVLARTTQAAPLFPLQVQSGLQPERAARIADAEWTMTAAAAAAALDMSLDLVDASGRRTVGGTSFIRVPAGTWPVGGSAEAAGGGSVPAVRTEAAFYVAETEVTVGQYQSFVAAVPEYSVENREELIASGLVDEHYLQDWANEPSSALPVRNVSYHAAVAYADWFTSTIDGAGLVAGLPSEDEWEVASRLNGIPDGAVFHQEGRNGPLPVGGSGVGRLGLIGMAGNVWEWCADWYATYSRLYPGPPEAGAHRVVRGGGWGNPEQGFRLADRGSQEPSWCTPFLGFRLVLREQ